MLDYKTQYNFANGIFNCFKTCSNYRMLSVNHSVDKMNTVKQYWPYYKYESFIKDNFVITCIYIMYKKAPSSINKMIDILNEIEFKPEVLNFKNDILSYKSLVTQDVDLIKSTYGKPTVQQIHKLYKNKQIKFYTFYWYLRNTEVTSKIIQVELQKIKSILLYVKFSQDGLKYIDTLFDESDLI